MPRPIYIIVNLRTSILPPLKIIATIHLFLPSFSFIIFPPSLLFPPFFDDVCSMDEETYREESAPPNDFENPVFIGSGTEKTSIRDYYRFHLSNELQPSRCVKLGRDESDADLRFNSRRVSLQK